MKENPPGYLKPDTGADEEYVTLQWYYIKFATLATPGILL